MNAKTEPTDYSITVPDADTLSKIFFPSADQYVYPTDRATADPQGNDAFLPIEVDTEFFHPALDLTRPGVAHSSPTITVQCRAIAIEIGTIFTHKDCAAYARHPVAESDFIIVDYLRSLGYSVDLKRENDFPRNLPVLQIDLYAYFAVAEVLRIVGNGCRDDIRDMCIDAERDGFGISQGRRLRTFTRHKNQYLPYINLPWVITINGCEYNIRLSWFDTSAVHGATDYAGFCSNTGTPLHYKDVFTSAEKANMLQMYIKRQQDFDNYALGDLYNHSALMNNVELFKTIYQSVDLEKWFKIPRLTTGATVRDLLEAQTAKIFAMIHPDTTPQKLVTAYCEHGTSEVVKQRLSTTGCYNAKVDGGRCRNNRPTYTIARGVLCDLDIDGCYGEGLRVQTYPIGVPIIIDYLINSQINNYQTLRQFRKTYEKELIPGLWQARVSTPPGYLLKYAQDFLMSWFPPKDISKMPTDTELSETEEWWTYDNVGLIKILNHQVNLAIINHDFFQWLDNIASKRQCKEMLDNLRVVTAMYYPASDRVSSVDELRARHDNHTGTNTCTVKKVRGMTTKISIEQECHAWYGVTLGEMGINTLLRERKKHKKKSPLNELYKLCVNTTYGDMVSPFFSIGNVVVGNNVTARARSLAWYMEKGLNGWQTITDGCAFDINRVLHPDKVRVNGETVVNHYRENSNKSDLVLRPIGLYDSIVLQADVNGEAGLNLSKKCRGNNGSCMSNYSECESVSDDCITVVNPKESLEWVSKTALIHLQNIFPIVDVLHQTTYDISGNLRQGQFSFEAKGLYDRAVFHGTANYCFWRFGEIARDSQGKEIIKMRSYSRKPQKLIGDDGLIIDNLDFLPAKLFLTSLNDHPLALPRQQPYLKSSILKVGDYSRHYKHRYENSKVFPGMTVEQGCLLREFSLAQFTYQTVDQYRAWERESEGLRKHYGQSYEMFFLNDDGTLRYQEMVETIDKMIAEGKNGYWDGRDKRAENGYRLQSAHPSQKSLDTVRQQLDQYYNYKGCRTEDDFDSEPEFSDWSVSD